ncbi:hypothetical protein [Brevibacterium aurantiacum]|uniref:Uncharacterized protein n=1 Tax=Brevibacterium aurantiacum TaxID=273384 RepID=A0A556CM53_BREAU|nr:hypothetical protein [Brevibacterium aurantiacum]TSI18515.1 hypothetical protein FO013_02810 [Brevibacterium aurantiacum]
MNNVTADLDTEVRRLRIRIIGLNPRQLAEAGPNSRVTTAGAHSRRDTIAEALAQFSSIGSDGRAVPDLGDQSLADQVVVLIEEGAASAEDLPEAQQQERLAQLLDAAVRLRRRLA